tara:strand:- start:2479 stop:2685 length:207 start_codon:yes stop_codon:yes gene_type:complete
MEKWEYKVLKLDGIFTSLVDKETELNSLGDQGWELITVDQHPYVWVFKRTKTGVIRGLDFITAPDLNS